MSIVHDLRTTDDPRDVVHRIVEVVARGGTAVLPTESEYVAVAAADQPTAVRRIVDAGDECGLMLRSADALWDYAAAASPRARRLVARATPAGIVFEWPLAGLEGGGLDSFGTGVTEQLSSGGHLGCWLPSLEFVREVLDLLPTPLVFSRLAGRTECPAEAECPWADAIADAGVVQRVGGTTFVRMGADTERVWTVVREGAVSESLLRRLDCTTIVFVCTGNTCRSPMAAGMFRSLLAERLECPVEKLSNAGFAVQSAGLSAGSGSPASLEAVRLLAQRGVDLTDHRSQPLTDALFDTADRVWTMTNSHLEAIRRVRPDASEKCDLLDPEGADVADPFGGGPEEYAECFEQIEALLHTRLDELLAVGDSGSMG